MALGLCKQSELDAAVAKAAKKREEVMTDDERRKLVSTEQSLEMEPEPRLPSAIEWLQSFSLSDPRDEVEDEDTTSSRDDGDYTDADSFFNLPGDSDDDDDEDDDRR